jgi:hypothetical protein
MPVVVILATLVCVPQDLISLGYLTELVKSIWL